MPGIGEDALTLLGDSQSPPVEMVLTTVVNDLGASGAEVVLVLDDYHVIDSPAVHEGMAFLLDQFRDAGLESPTDPNHGLDLKALAVHVKMYTLQMPCGPQL